MFRASPRTLGEVVDWGLCIGCGACVSACGERGIRMVHLETEGYRPVFDHAPCAACTTCVDICPGAKVDASLGVGGPPRDADADEDVGPALEIWEGWASDPEVRYKGSSGGLLSALSLYCLDSGAYAGVVHSGMDPGTPWMNRNFVSRSREEVLARAGSRYAPSAPCAALVDLPPDGPYVFIGKPCDAAAVTALERRNAGAARQVGLVLTFFCAGTPSTRGTLDLLRRLDTDPGEVREVHYRGEGWPGTFRVKAASNQVTRTLTYEESWAALTAYRPLRCHLCPDGLGRVADIAVGDAWERYDGRNGSGISLALVRTERGRAVLEGARKAGYVTLQRVGPDAVLRAQPSLLERRRTLFGRLAAFRMAGASVPAYPGFALFRSWRRIGVAAQARSVFGTLRRIARRGWFRRRPRTIAPYVTGVNAQAGERP